jgi:hypothetical protein
VLQDNQAYRRFVKLGNTFDTEVEILSGLDAGDIILPLPERSK